MRYPFDKQFVICIGPHCNAESRGEERGEVIQREVKALNKSLGRKPTVRVCKVSCLDLCDHGPNMVVWPDGTVYSHLDLASAIRAYHGEMGEGEKAEDKMLRKEELDKE